MASGFIADWVVPMKASTDTSTTPSSSLIVHTGRGLNAKAPDRALHHDRYEVPYETGPELSLGYSGPTFCTAEENGRIHSSTPYRFLAAGRFSKPSYLLPSRRVFTSWLSRVVAFAHPAQVAESVVREASLSVPRLRDVAQVLLEPVRKSGTYFEEVSK